MGGPGSGRKPNSSSNSNLNSRVKGVKKYDYSIGNFNTPRKKKELNRLREERYGKK